VLEYSSSNSQSIFVVTGAADASMNAFSASMSVGDTTIGGVVELGVAFKSGILTYSAANQITVSTTHESKGTFSATGIKQVFMGLPAAALDTDGTLAADSDAKIATQKAVKTYADTKIAASYIDTDGTLAADSDAKIATQKAVKTYVATYIAAQDVEVLKGAIDCSGDPNFPAADAGHVYRVSVAGRIGGASGDRVEQGDRLECFVDGTAAGTKAAVGANWLISQVNIDGAVVGPSSATNNGFARYDGTSGKLLKDGAASVNLASEVSGNLPVSHLNGGTGASATSFWRGDGVWGTLSGAGDMLAANALSEIASSDWKSAQQNIGIDLSRPIQSGILNPSFALWPRRPASGFTASLNTIVSGDGPAGWYGGAGPSGLFTWSTPQLPVGTIPGNPPTCLHIHFDASPTAGNPGDYPNNVNRNTYLEQLTLMPPHLGMGTTRTVVVWAEQTRAFYPTVDIMPIYFYSCGGMFWSANETFYADEYFQHSGYMFKIVTPGTVNASAPTIPANQAAAVNETLGTCLPSSASARSRATGTRYSKPRRHSAMSGFQRVRRTPGRGSPSRAAAR
jgi:hypothetical protein